MKKRRNRITSWEVRVVPPEMYPDLKINPTNHWTKMRDEDRLEYLIQTMTRIWAETVQEQEGCASDKGRPRAG